MDATANEVKRVLELQKQLNITEGAPSAALRADRLDRCMAMVIAYKKEIVESMQDDFGNRDPIMSATTEVDSVIGPMVHAKKNLKKWMKSEKRKASIAGTGPLLSLTGAKAVINYQPKGCLLYTSPSPRDATLSRMPSSA